jgi:hypothetical protein
MRASGIPSLAGDMAGSLRVRRLEIDPFMNLYIFESTLSLEVSDVAQH